MIELWGTAACTSCGIAKDLILSTPLEMQYVDVAQTGYEGLIPLLIDTETGQRIEGLNPIKNYVMAKLKEMGFESS